MQRYFTTIKKGNNFTLSSEDLYHIKTVMRMTNDSKLEVVYDKKLFLCHLTLPDTITIDKETSSNQSSLLDITLVIPVLKEPKMDLILQKATELGVSNIIPVMMERSIVKVDGKELKKVERWQKICKEASEQSKRLLIPHVSNVMSLKELNKIDGLKLVCSTKEQGNTIRNLLHNLHDYDKITIVVGPEGGLSSNEEDSLIKDGFIPVTLGNLIMRVETVPIYLLSVINYINME